jgi:hypothetical protein
MDCDSLPPHRLTVEDAGGGGDAHVDCLLPPSHNAFLFAPCRRLFPTTIRIWGRHFATRLVSRGPPTEQRFVAADP